MIALAACPIWLSCPSCGTRLVGNRLVKLQAAVVVCAAAALGLLINLAMRAQVLSSGASICVAVVAVGVIAVPNVVITHRYGEYVEQRRKR